MLSQPYEKVNVSIDRYSFFSYDLIMLPIYGVSGSPQTGNTLYYDLHRGTLQACSDSSSHFTMPVTRRDNGRITNWVHAHTKPEFMWRFQYGAIPYEGGIVESRAFTTTKLAKTLSDIWRNRNRYVVELIVQDSQDRTEQLGQTLASTISVSTIQMPMAYSGVGSDGISVVKGYKLRINVPIADEDYPQFETEFKKAVVMMGFRVFSMTIEPQTETNWTLGIHYPIYFSA